MSAFTVSNSQGDTVATVNVASTTGNTFPVEIIGTGIGNYGKIVGTNTYHLLENFASTIKPTNPVIGMNWYSLNAGYPHFYNGTQFVPYATAVSSAATRFNMETAATNLDFTTAATTVVFQSPNDGTTFYPTGILLVPNGAITTTTPAIFNLYVTTSEDVTEDITLISASDEKHEFYTIQGSTKFLSGTESLKLEIKTEATGGNLAYDVHVFGFTTV